MSILIVVVHFVTDWILQPRAVARRKAASWLWMLKHLGVILFGTEILFWLSGRPVLLAFVYTLAHGIQDKIIWRLYEWRRGPYTADYLEHNRYAEDYWWYFTIAVDQVLHLSLLFWLLG